jgi:hypothetical protein
MEIRSPHIKAALCEVVPEYADMKLHSPKIVIRDCHICLFHYHRELQEYGKKT